MSRVLPILFNTEMVRAILDGRKTVTRRCVKYKNSNGTILPVNSCAKYIGRVNEFFVWEDTNAIWHVKPPYQPKDTMYVRETWRVGAWDIRNQMIAFDYKDGACGELTYIHDRELFERLVNQSREDARKAKCEYNGVDFVWKKGNSPCRWHPNIHMPKEAARIWLKVKDVRVERLHEIDDSGAYSEGTGHADWIYQNGARRCEFAKLWNSTIKKADLDLYGWDANLWVWVIEFERCEEPEGGNV